MPRKIAMIGAGSMVFCKTLMSDIMATPALSDSEFALMSPTETKLRRMETFAKRMIKDNGLKASVWATTNRQEAIKNADFVVVMVQVGGMEAFGHDYNIPLKYGVDQCIGDSLGPGGVFRGLRTRAGAGRHRPRHGGAGQARRDHAAIRQPDGRQLPGAGPHHQARPFVGLCHGVQTTLDLIAGYCRVPKSEITYTCGGINHMDWFLRLEHKGRDLYPMLRELFEKPEYYKNEKVRGEVFRHFGYFMTESTGHLSEYVPWFRKNKKALDLYCDEASFGGESGAYYKYGKRAWPRSTPSTIRWNSRPARSSHAAWNTARTSWRPWRPGPRRKALPLHGQRAATTDTSRICPPGAAWRCRSSSTTPGCTRCVVGELPPQCAAACQTNVTVQILAVEAGHRGRHRNTSSTRSPWTR